MMKDLAILQDSPFSDLGRINEIFDDTEVFTKLRTVIEGINANARTAA
jgi:type I restriction enzyme R subunit